MPPACSPRTESPRHAGPVAPFFVVLSAFSLGPTIHRRRESQSLRTAFSWLVTRSLTRVRARPAHEGFTGVMADACDAAGPRLCACGALFPATCPHRPAPKPNCGSRPKGRRPGRDSGPG